MDELLAEATGLLIDGDWRSPTGITPVRDKFSGAEFRTVAEAAGSDVERAVTGAVRAAEVPLPPRERCRLLEQAAATLAANEPEIVANYVAETGFTRADGAGELGRAVSIFQMSAQEAVRIAGEEVPVAANAGSEARLAFTLRVPLGVVGAIAPFNAPLSTVAHKVAPALAAGNSVVLKPAAATPLSSMAIAEALRRAGLPPGQLQLVCGPGKTVGNQLVADRRVRYFTFTGSTAVGLALKQNSGIARTHLELGANSASIVAADADIDLVARSVARAGYRKAGQVCTSVQRLLVDRGVLGPLAGRLTDRVSSLVVGDPSLPTTDVGPMIAATEAERAQAWIADAVDRGAHLLCGGQRTGALLSPTLLGELPADSKIMTEEIFAPVVAIVPIAGVEQGINLINSGNYGLQAGVFTRDIDIAFAAARQLQVGGVMINDTSSYHADNMPYGGVKDSGYGVEGPRYAIADMTHPRTVVLNLRAPADAIDAG
jgi:acyl-CoA reductase-like NAD-dependent aldehyde dehydrogenase